MKRYHSYLGRDIVVTAGSARDLQPGQFGVLAIDGGAGGWSVVHKGPDGDVMELNNEMHFELPEDALAFAKELIDLMASGGAEA
ncbi:hypothetical protein ACG02S_01220 [Roseateles sp. DC23W]|uniref:Uncharacterized protein n=1 Tax=Pelomonas dachongensis TaxID=3299029 RepID=A0ABW7EGD2_9BURK